MHKTADEVISSIMTALGGHNLGAALCAWVKSVEERVEARAEESKENENKPEENEVIEDEPLETEPLGTESFDQETHSKD